MLRIGTGTGVVVPQVPTVPLALARAKYTVDVTVFDPSMPPIT